MSEYDPGVKARIGEKLAEIHAANEYKQMLDAFRGLMFDKHCSLTNDKELYILQWALDELGKKVK